MASLLWAGKTPAVAPDATASLYNGVPRSGGKKKTTAPKTPSVQKSNAVARANHLSARVDSRLMPNEFASAVEDARMAQLAEASLASASPTKMSWSELQTKERYAGFQMDRGSGRSDMGASPSKSSADVKSDEDIFAAKKDLLKLKPNWVGVHHIVATASATAGDVAWASRLRQSPKHAGRNIVAGTTPPRLHLGARSGGGGGAILKATRQPSALSKTSRRPDLNHIKAKVDTGRSRPPPSRPKSRLDPQTKTKATVTSASQRTSNFKFNSTMKQPVNVEKRAASLNNGGGRADAKPAAKPAAKPSTKKAGSLQQTSKALQNIDKLTSRLDAFSSHKGPGKLRRFYLSVFKQFRELEAQNALLRDTVRSQDDELTELKHLADLEKSKAMVLELEVSRVNTAAKDLRSVLDPAFDEKISGGGGLVPRDLLLRDPAGDGEDLDTAGRSAQWVRQGLIEIFCRFDADNDGILSCDELNSLRAELGSPAPPLTLSQFDCMCREHGLKRSRGGLSIDGFLDMYECTGRAAALADLEALGITLGPLLFPRQALAEATRRLVDAREALHTSQQREIDMSQMIRDKNDRLQRSEARLREAMSTRRIAQSEREAAARDLVTLQHKYVSEQENHREGLRRESVLQSEIVKLRKELTQVKHILSGKIDEKEALQNMVQSMEESTAVANAAARSAKLAESRMKKEKIELARKNQVLHMTLTNRQKQYGRIASDKRQGVVLSDGSALDGRVGGGEAGSKNVQGLYNGEVKVPAFL